LRGRPVPIDVGGEASSAKEAQVFYEQDARIWRHQKFVQRPLLARQDVAGYTALRRWSNHFCERAGAPDGPIGQKPKRDAASATAAVNCSALVRAASKASRPASTRSGGSVASTAASTALTLKDSSAAVAA